MATTKLILYIGRLFIYSAKVEKRNGDEKKKWTENKCPIFIFSK